MASDLGYYVHTYGTSGYTLTTNTDGTWVVTRIDPADGTVTLDYRRAKPKEPTHNEHGEIAP